MEQYRTVEDSMKLYYKLQAKTVHTRKKEKGFSQMVQIIKWRE